MSFPWFKKKQTEPPEPLAKLKNMLDHKKKVTYKLSNEDEIIVNQIRQKTNLANLNNITRTHAYLTFYKNHPEIHWSFLAHMVSRNAGWNMTDLKGSCLTRLLSTKEAEAFFLFLERGNWLIFLDAYPQLLVYEESIKQGKDFTYLLPHLFVSSYMETVWSYFLNSRDSSILTIALIINEQNHLEQTLMNEPHIQNKIVDKLEFTLQDVLAMNQILFPYLDQERKIKLTGKTIHHFEQLNSRISIGKDLYSLLFNKQMIQLVEQWAFTTPHTGSRKDYWPHLFNHVNEEPPGKKYTSRLEECKIALNSPRFYSPPLLYAWKDVNHRVPQYSDWYKNSAIVELMIPSAHLHFSDVEVDYCKTLEKLEMACLAKKVFPLF